MPGRRRSRFQAGRYVDPRFAPVLALIASGVRRAILVELSRGPTDARTLAKALNLSMGSVRHQLGRLREHDLVRVERSGRRHIYRVGPRATVIAGRDKAILNVSTRSGAEATVTVPIT
jgi:DNA-binding transcriptional ArsR family regulator